MTAQWFGIVQKIGLRFGTFAFQTCQSNPRITNCVTGYTTYSCGDILSQKILNNEKEIDYERAAYAGSLGIIMNGLVLHRWYNYLDKTFGSSMHEKKGIYLKMIVDQIIYAPFSITVFLAFASIMAVRTPKILQERDNENEIFYYIDYEKNKEKVIVSNMKISNKINDTFIKLPSDQMEKIDRKRAAILIQKMNDSLLSIWVADCFVWPFVNYINFSYIPKNYRPSFVGVALLFWQTFVSSLGHKKVEISDKKIEIIEK